MFSRYKISPRTFSLIILLTTVLFLGLFLYYDSKITINLPPYAKTDIENVIKCQDKKPTKHITQHGEYFIINNFIIPERSFKCYETITYTTTADYKFLNNLPELILKWKGPISIAVYVPGDDFKKSLESISYLRNCESEIIRDLVTFHVFFHADHLPKNNALGLINAYDDEYNCSNPAPYSSSERLYRHLKNLPYPINIARNVARQEAVTYFVLCSDIELYPSPNFIQDFLEMIVTNRLKEIDKINPSVYVLPVFEILEGIPFPENKTILRKLVKDKKAFWFHRNLCKPCHGLPKEEEWLNTEPLEKMQVFTKMKRLEKYKNSEAIYVGTNRDPLFDERLTWEGKSDKMSQGYIQCLLNYDYMILDKAYLVHKNGVKKMSQSNVNYASIQSTNKFLRPQLLSELDLLYGRKKGCSL